MAYIVLAAGYPSVAEKMSGRKMDLAPDERVVDFIIKIDGLPKEFFIPTQVTRRKKYYCTSCKRDVPDVEIEFRTGCFSHPLEVKEELIESWNNSVFEKYEIPKLQYLKPMYRIWLNNPEGEEKWRLIYKYIQSHYPAHKMIPEPTPMGNRMQVLISIDTIPYIDLELASDEIEAANMAIKGLGNSGSSGSVGSAGDKEMDKVTTNARGMYECHVCGKELTSYRGLSSHIRAAHDGIMEKAKDRIRQEATSQTAKTAQEEVKNEETVK